MISRHSTCSRRQIQLATIENCEARLLLSNYPLTLGSAGRDNAIQSVIDANGDVICVGAFSGTVDFDPTAGVKNRTATGVSSTFVAKYHADGSLVWVRKVGGIAQDDDVDDFGEAQPSVAVDAAGNVYVAGQFSGTQDFDPGAGVSNLSGSGAVDLFIAKLNARGNYVWAKKMGGVRSESAARIVVSGSSVYTVGRFQGKVDFNPGPSTYYRTARGSSDLFVSKLDLAGNFAWARQIGDTVMNAPDDNDQWATSAAIDSAGNLIIVGGFQGTTDFNPASAVYALTSESHDYFVMRMAPNGMLGWVKPIRGTGLFTIRDVALDASDNVYFTGAFTRTVDMDPGASVARLRSAGGGDVFVARFTKSGAYYAAKSMGGTGNELGWSIAAAGNRIYLAGAFTGTADFDPSAGIKNLTSAGKTDMFVCALDTSLNFSWARRFGGAKHDWALGVTVDSAGSIYVSGFRDGNSALFAPSDIDLLSGGQIHLLKLTPTGSAA